MLDTQAASNFATTTNISTMNFLIICLLMDMRLISLGYIQGEKLLGHLFILTKLCQVAPWIVLVFLLSMNNVSIIFIFYQL